MQPILVPKTTIDFSGDSDVDLLAYMGMRDEDPGAARDAFAEFYQRHALWLYKSMRGKFMKQLPDGEDGVKDLVQETFQKAYLGAHTFDAGSQSNAGAICGRVRAWLGAIGNNIRYDLFRLPDGLDGAIELSDLLYKSVVEPSSELSPEAEFLRGVLDALSDRERDIVLENAFHMTFHGKHQRLPNEVSAALVRRWNTTPENIRAIRSRTYKKIKEALLARSQQMGA